MEPPPGPPLAPKPWSVHVPRDFWSDPTTPAPPPPGAGFPLVLGEDGGGQRHFLDGERVCAGELLWLEAPDGWIAVRYESRWPGGRLLGVLYGLTPDGTAADIPPDARFAWRR